MATLKYLPPSPALRDYISVYYLFQCPETAHVDHERAAIGQIRFLLSGTGTTDFITGNSYFASGDFAVGPTSGVMRLRINGPMTLFGIGLLPAGWAALTTLPACDLADKAAPANTIFPQACKALAAVHDIADITDLDAMAALADAVLGPLLVEAPPGVLQFTRTVDDWLSANVSPDVAELQAHFKMSDRQLTRKVKQYYGMPPKYLSRKYRALRAARALVNADPAETDFLRDAFYDQSHMIRELKLFTGVTPHKLRKGEGDIAALIDQRALFDGEISPLVAGT